MEDLNLLSMMSHPVQGDSPVHVSCWGSLQKELVQAVFASKPIKDDIRARVMGIATCKTWREALRQLHLQNLIITADMVAKDPKARQLAVWLAAHCTHPLKHLSLPRRLQYLLGHEVDKLNCQELSQLRMHVGGDVWRLERLLSSTSSLPSLHLTLTSLLPNTSLHTQLERLGPSLRDLHLTTPQGGAPGAQLELAGPLPALTHLCIGRPFHKATLDFALMPNLRVLQLRMFKKPTGYESLAECTQLEELEIISSAGKLLDHVHVPSLRRLTLHRAPGGRDLSAGPALTALKALAVRGQLCGKLDADTLPFLQALYVEDKQVTLQALQQWGLLCQLCVLHMPCCDPLELRSQVFDLKRDKAVAALGNLHLGPGLSSLAIDEASSVTLPQEVGAGKQSGSGAEKPKRGRKRGRGEALLADAARTVAVADVGVQLAKLALEESMPVGVRVVHADFGRWGMSVRHRGW